MLVQDGRHNHENMTVSDLHLYIGNKNYSSWSLRAWLALKQTDAAFAETVIPLYRDDSTATLAQYSPSGRVPVLQHRDRTIWESLAIGEYLAELFPDAGLWPKEPYARAVARAVSNEIHAGFTALRAHLPMDMRARQRQHAGGRAVTQDIRRIVDLWSDCRQRFGKQGRFLFGAYSLADAMYAPVVSRFVTYGITVEGRAAEYLEAAWNWPALQAWADAAQAEPWVIEVLDNR
jgi:glutathione S-transferase